MPAQPEKHAIANVGCLGNLETGPARLELPEEADHFVTPMTIPSAGPWTQHLNFGIEPFEDGLRTNLEEQIEPCPDCFGIHDSILL